MQQNPGELFIDYLAQQCYTPLLLNISQFTYGMVSNEWRINI